MAGMRLEHADAARAALQAVVSDPAGGTEALSSAEVAANLMRDLLPDAPREANLLVTAISVGIPAVLRAHVAEGMDADTAIGLAAALLEDRTAFTHDAARWAAVEFAVALGLAGPGGRPGTGPAGTGPVSVPARLAVTEQLTRDALRKAIGTANPQLNSAGWHIVSFACLGRWAAVAVDAVSVGSGEGFLKRTPSGWTPAPLSGGVYNCSDLQGSSSYLAPPQPIAYSLFKDVGRCPPP